jgi:CDP-4-dehydro-6-deoxyglucose reductase, E1
MVKLMKSVFLGGQGTKKALADFIMNADQLSFGPQCETFEKQFAEWQGRKYCVFVNSGSSANLALVQAFLNLGKLKKGDMVGFSALTWSTNVMPLIELGLVAVPIDVEFDTLNVSSKKLIERCAEFPLKALFLTNLLGLCDDIEEIRQWCKKNNIVFFEDNCESLGTVYQGKKLGNFGLASTFSFFIGHHLSTIEGGAVCTDDAELAQMLRMVRAHGWDRNLKSAEQVELREKYGTDSFYGKYTFYDLGYNLRPTEIAGFLGNSQIPYADEMPAAREKNFKVMAAALAKNDAYYPTRWDHIDLISSFALPIICRDEATRKALVARAEGRIEVRPIVGGDITQQPFFKKYAPEAIRAVKNPNADLIHKNGLYAPNNPELTSEDIATIIDVIA